MKGERRVRVGRGQAGERAMGACCLCARAHSALTITPGPLALRGGKAEGLQAAGATLASCTYSPSPSLCSCLQANIAPAWPRVTFTPTTTLVLARGDTLVMHSLLMKGAPRAAVARVVAER